MKSERLRLGAFGVGRMGLVHLEHLIALHQEGEIELVAIGDRFGPTLWSVSPLLNELGGPDLARIARFDDPDAMAAATRLDGVVIASRTEDHARDSQAFIRCGTPVLVEKPFANSIAEAADFCRMLGDVPNRLVQVGFQRHFDAAARAALDWIASGRIGRLQQSHHVLQDKNPTPVGYQSCGITADMAIHLVFEAMSVHGFELPGSVQALRFAAPHYDDRAGEGANIVHTFCTWADGTVAHLWGSRINSAGYDNGFKLIGTEGRIDVGEFVGDFGAVTARLWSGVGDDRGRQIAEARFPMTRPSARHPDFYARYAAAYGAEISAFIHCLRSNAPFDPGPDLGWKTLFVANLAEASSRSGGRRFDLEQADGSAITTVVDAAAYAGAVASLAEAHDRQPINPGPTARI
jgi:myo-inositol 2-dehydrogenase/D-chiro-inositol 1-dehydrogenase